MKSQSKYVYTEVSPRMYSQDGAYLKGKYGLTVSGMCAASLCEKFPKYQGLLQRVLTRQEVLVLNTKRLI